MERIKLLLSFNVTSSFGRILVEDVTTETTYILFPLLLIATSEYRRSTGWE
jgi:hypothetical protein